MVSNYTADLVYSSGALCILALTQNLMSCQIFSYEKYLLLQIMVYLSNATKANTFVLANTFISTKLKPAI